MARLIDADALMKELPVHPEGGMRSIKNESLMIRVRETVKNAPTIGGWISVKEVANIIADLFGDECACNSNDIDEWLPQYCEYRDTDCPHPPGVACWEQYLKHLDKKPNGGG